MTICISWRLPASEMLRRGSDIMLAIGWRTLPESLKLGAPYGVISDREL